MVPGWYYGFSWFQVSFSWFRGLGYSELGAEVRSEMLRTPQKSYPLDLYLVPTIPPSGVNDDEEDHIYITTRSSVCSVWNLTKDHGKPRNPTKDHEIQPKTMKTHEIQPRTMKASQVKAMKIPWKTIGPTKNHETNLQNHETTLKTFQELAWNWSEYKEVLNCVTLKCAPKSCSLGLNSRRPALA